jgi:hypothetical protein
MHHVCFTILIHYGTQTTKELSAYCSCYSVVCTSNIRKPQKSVAERK